MFIGVKNGINTRVRNKRINNDSCSFFFPFCYIALGFTIRIITLSSFINA